MRLAGYLHRLTLPSVALLHTVSFNSTLKLTRTPKQTETNNSRYFKAVENLLAAESTRVHLFTGVLKLLSISC